MHLPWASGGRDLQWDLSNCGSSMQQNWKKRRINRQLSLTVVVTDEVEMDNYGIGGETVMTIRNKAKQEGPQ
jgi:hypothetical protein